jgi:hypothetical protein
LARVACYSFPDYVGGNDVRASKTTTSEERTGNASAALPSVVQSSDLYERVASPELISPFWFLCGLLVSFALCCLSGRAIAATNLYENFHRFHNYINPTSSYYPTVSQMVSLVEAKTKAEQTIVILGGNSVFYGFGQNGDDLWSLSLQQMLGDKYAVFNFAMPSSDPFEGAYWAAEALLKKHRKVIYATVAHPATTGFPEGSDVYGYAYWDAHEKHLLVHDRTRDALVAERVAGHNPQKQQKLVDLKLRAVLDSIFYFEDFWTAIGYSKLFTVWTEPTAASPLKARNDYSEETYQLVPIEQRVKIDFMKALKMDYRACFEPNSTQLDPNFWALMVKTAGSLTPNPFKRNCMVVVSAPMPRYRALLSELERTRENIASDASRKAWSAAGYQQIGFKDEVTDEDYADAVHLDASGGKKLAAVVADKVRSMATDLRYGE